LVKLFIDHLERELVPLRMALWTAMKAEA